MAQKELYETLLIWQPIQSLKGKYLDSINLVEVLRQDNYFKITLQDLEGNIVDIIYDDPQNICPLEYVVWGFRYSTELGELGKQRFKIEDPNNRAKKDAAYFGKVINSNYIKEFNNNPIANQKLFPGVEHHIYLTGNEILEVVSNYEPKFVERTY